MGLERSEGSRSDRLGYSDERVTTQSGVSQYADGACAGANMAD